MSPVRKPNFLWTTRTELFSRYLKKLSSNRWKYSLSEFVWFLTIRHAQLNVKIANATFSKQNMHSFLLQYQNWVGITPNFYNSFQLWLIWSSVRNNKLKAKSYNRNGMYAGTIATVLCSQMAKKWWTIEKWRPDYAAAGAIPRVGACLVAVLSLRNSV